MTHTQASHAGSRLHRPRRERYVLLRLDPEAEGSDCADVRHVRVPYDVKRAAEAIEQSPLPDAFARMLREAG